MNARNIYFLLLVFLTCEGYSQNKANMTKPLRVSLNKGQNKVMHYQGFEIEPINLYVQDRPYNDRSVHIQLELNIKKGDKLFHTFLWFSESGNAPPPNYPQVWEKYLFSLDIGANDAVTFVVEELNFGKPFFINIGKEAEFGTLTVKFSESTDVMGASSNGDFNATSYAIYELLLSENKEEKKISFTSLDKNSQKIQFKWKNYEIKVLKDDLKMMKLVVFKSNE